MLDHRHDVGDGLSRVVLIGEAIPHRDAGVLGQLSDYALAEAAVLDAVVHAAEDPGRVLHRFLVADLRPAGSQVGDVRALVVGGDLEGAARAGRGLLEDERDVLALEALFFLTLLLGRLQLLREFEKVENLFARIVLEGEEAPIPQVYRHRSLCSHRFA